MAHPVQNKGFLQPSTEADMLSRPSAETCTPPLVGLRITLTLTGQFKSSDSPSSMTNSMTVA